VGWLDVAMDQSLPMQVGQCFAQRDSDLDALHQGQPVPALDVFAQRPWDVALGFNLLLADHVVRHVHDVKEAARRLVPSNVEDADKARMGPGHSVEMLDPIEFPVEGAVAVKLSSPYDLYGAISTQDA